MLCFIFHFHFLFFVAFQFCNIAFEVDFLLSATTTFCMVYENDDGKWPKGFKAGAGERFSIFSKNTIYWDLKNIPPFEIFADLIHLLDVFSPEKRSRIKFFENYSEITRPWFRHIFKLKNIWKCNVRLKSRKQSGTKKNFAGVQHKCLRMQTFCKTIWEHFWKVQLYKTCSILKNKPIILVWMCADVCRNVEWMYEHIKQK